MSSFSLDYETYRGTWHIDNTGMYAVLTHVVHYITWIQWLLYRPLYISRKAYLDLCLSLSLLLLWLWEPRCLFLKSSLSLLSFPDSLIALCFGLWVLGQDVNLFFPLPRLCDLSRNLTRKTNWNIRPCYKSFIKQWLYQHYDCTSEYEKLAKTCYRRSLKIKFYT